MGRSQSGRLGALLGAVLVMTLPGCRSVLLVAPPSPAPLGPPRLMAPQTRPDVPKPMAGGVRLGELTLEGDGARVPSHSEAAFRVALEEHLRAAFPPADPTLPPLVVDVTYRFQVHRQSALALDILSTVTLGLFFYSPERGVALVELSLVPRSPERHAERHALRLTVLSPWHSHFTPWFAREGKQRRLDHAHQVAFERMVVRLREWAARSERGEGDRRDPGEGSGGAAPSALASAPAAPRIRWYHVTPRLHGAPLWQAEEETPAMRITREVVEARERVGILGTLLELLGGVSLGYAYGSAWVSSQVRDQAGRLSQIASGRGVTHGAGFSLYAPPRHSGFYFYPTVGLLWQQITIADAAGMAAQAEQQGARDIPAVARDPNTGAPVDLAAPWGYQLTLTSLYLGPRLGLALVLGRRTSGYLALEGGMNLVEWRHMRVRWDDYQGGEHRFAAAESFAGRAVVGLVHRPWHLGVQCIAGVELFRRFQYPEEIPFRGPVAYDSSLQAFQRPVQFARGASLRTLALHCGLVAFY